MPLLKVRIYTFYTLVPPLAADFTITLADMFVVAELPSSFLLLILHETLAAEVINAPTEHDQLGGCLGWHGASIREVQFGHERKLIV